MASGKDSLQDIYTESYILDLLTVVRNNGDVEKFIADKDKKNRDEFIATANTKRQSSIDENNKVIKNAENKIHMLQEEKRVFNEITSKIQHIKSLYPKDKQYQLKNVLDNIQSEGGLQKHIAELTAPPRGFMVRT